MSTPSIKQNEELTSWEFIGDTSCLPDTASSSPKTSTIVELSGSIHNLNRSMEETSQRAMIAFERTGCLEEFLEKISSVFSSTFSCCMKEKKYED